MSTKGNEPIPYGNNGAGGIWHLPPHTAYSWDLTGMVTQAVDKDEIRRLRRDFDRGIYPNSDILLIYDVSTASGQSRVNQVRIGLQDGILQVGGCNTILLGPSGKIHTPTNKEVIEAVRILQDEILKSLGNFGYVRNLDLGTGRMLPENVEISRQIVQFLMPHIPESMPLQGLESLMQ